MERQDGNSDVGNDTDDFVRSSFYSQISLSLRVLREADHLPEYLVAYHAKLLQNILFIDVDSRSYQSQELT